MKVLLDECTPHVLKRLLTNVEIITVQEMGWSGITNGALLRRAESQFDVLITSDQNWSISRTSPACRSRLFNYQQIKFRKLSHSRPIQAGLNRIQPGDFVAIPM